MLLVTAALLTFCLLCPAPGERRYILSRCIYHRFRRRSCFTRDFRVPVRLLRRIMLGNKKNRWPILVSCGDYSYFGEAFSFDLMKGGFLSLRSRDCPYRVMIIDFLPHSCRGVWRGCSVYNNGKLVFCHLLCGDGSLCYNLFACSLTSLIWTFNEGEIIYIDKPLH